MAYSIDRRGLIIGAYNLDTYARTERHVADLADCGINLVVCLAKPDQAILDLLQRYHVGCIASGVLPGWWGGRGDRAGLLAETNPLGKYEEASGTFTNHPAIWGLDIGDEPSALDFDYYGQVIATVERLFPGKLPYLNLYPNYASVAENDGHQTINQLGTPTYAEHIRQYASKIALPYISYDFYMYSLAPSRLGQMYDNFRVVADTCRQTGRDFWYIPQCNGRHESDFTSANRMRFQAYAALAYGATAINWACWTKGWWSNNILDGTGQRTEQYDKLKVVNGELHRLGDRYMDFRNVDTHLLGFETIPAVREDAGLVTRNSLDTGFARDFHASEGTSLIVGQMVGRDNPSRTALFVCNATDYLDAAPSATRIRFRSLRPDVRLFGGEGCGRLDHGSDDSYSFTLENCHGALLTFAG